MPERSRVLRVWVDDFDVSHKMDALPLSVAVCSDPFSPPRDCYSEPSIPFTPPFSCEHTVFMFHASFFLGRGGFCLNRSAASDAFINVMLSSHRSCLLRSVNAEMSIEEITAHVKAAVFFCGHFSDSGTRQQRRRIIPTKALIFLVVFPVKEISVSTTSDLF